jgi:hypothetical protein
VKKILLAVVLFIALASCWLGPAVSGPGNSADTGGVPENYWPLRQSQLLVDQIATVRLAPDLSALGDGERRALDKLLKVGEIFQRLYEAQLHDDALRSYQALELLDQKSRSPAVTQNLLTLYRLFQGPIATTLQNTREPFLPVEMPGDGVGVYPRRITKQEVDAFLVAHPERRADVLHVRTVVRRALTENLQRDLGKLRQYPVLDTLHPGLQRSLQQMLATPSSTGLYAVPYAVAYADELLRVHALLNEAADLLSQEDPEFSRYLRNRSRDLLSDDYESGDAAWVTSHFKHLNAQIGAYETYDDSLYGAKSFFGLSLVSLRARDSEALRRAVGGLQALQDALPYRIPRKVREDIPIGSYDVIADFGEARGENTATILPNEEYLVSRYGRVILMRSDMIRSPAVFEPKRAVWMAVMHRSHAEDLTSEGSYHRYAWHEVGHYLGVATTQAGQAVKEALQEDSNLIEELKADLIALFVAEILQGRGFLDQDQLRSVYANGVLRVLQNNRPRRDQVYATMQLMQWNFFLEQKLLSFDRSAVLLSIDYGRYHEVVGRMLAQVLELQHRGDKAATDRFVEKYSRWDDDLHGALAAKIRGQQTHRYRLFKYAALGE